MALFGPLLYPKVLPQNPNLIYAPPSLAHPLGTDYAGTDVLADIITGAQLVLYVALLTAVFHLVIGVVLGLVSGYVRGVVDAIIMRMADMFLTIPQFPLLIVLSTMVNMENPFLLAGVLAVTGWGGLARTIRSQVLSLRERDFIEAARGMGLPAWRIVFTEIMPNMGPYIAINSMLSITSAVYNEVGLFFLGFLPFVQNNWGLMLNVAFNQAGAMYTTKSLLYLLCPLACILALNYTIILLTGAVDEIMNPRLSTV